eukprot:TRINITY_DN3290_c1_g1_i2.p1 TRINITY_DN3290_c1_g1~~TRINITY_DN3290_c1_g1_i2.p1  ORF type:complete len:65 (-),score=0.23 TRINITY_DN3290_c1_g1_i2:439-633(-)
MNFHNNWMMVINEIKIYECELEFLDLRQKFLQIFFFLNKSIDCFVKISVCLSIFLDALTEIITR